MPSFQRPQEANRHAWRQALEQHAQVCIAVREVRMSNALVRAQPEVFWKVWSDALRETFEAALAEMGAPVAGEGKKGIPG
eukprot:9450085-Alexandrium_andersonii.AAC.1